MGAQIQLHAHSPTHHSAFRKEQPPGAAIGACHCDEQPQVSPLMASDADMTLSVRVFVHIQDMDLDLVASIGDTAHHLTHL